MKTLRLFAAYVLLVLAFPIAAIVAARRGYRRVRVRTSLGVLALRPVK